jgi:hypothetical protein
MSIAASLGIEADLYGACEYCGKVKTLVKRWGEKDASGRRKFACVECAANNDLVFKAMFATLIKGS